MCSFIHPLFASLIYKFLIMNSIWTEHLYFPKGHWLEWPCDSFFTLAKRGFHPNRRLCWLCPLNERDEKDTKQICDSESKLRGNDQGETDKRWGHHIDKLQGKTRLIFHAPCGPTNLFPWLKTRKLISFYYIISRCSVWHYLLHTLNWRSRRK